MKKQNFIIFIMLLNAVLTNAQIGYQVSLLNSATGEPRANETVNVEVEITNSEGTIICSETKSATTNDFGVLAMQIGNASTFENVDWSKLPLYVSATVDGIMIGKSQILNVPVAEAAKTLVGADLDLICKTWTWHGREGETIRITLSRNNTFSYYKLDNEGDSFNISGKYLIQGNIILLLCDSQTSVPFVLAYYNGSLFGSIEGWGNLQFN